MGFKFLNNISETPTDNPNYNILSIDNRPAVFINLNRNRIDISELEWDYLLQEQRKNLIDYMWEQGLISHTIISEDENGFSLRTEINF